MNIPTDGAPWVVAGDITRTHAEIETRARRAATGFVAQGIGEGTVVALLLHNDFAVFEAQRGAALVGAIAVPLDKHLSAEDLLFILSDCEARLLIVHADLAESLPRLPTALAMIRVATPAFVRANGPAASIDDGRGWDDWLASRDVFSGEAAAAGTPTLGYTSGSSGRPKAVRRNGTAGTSAKAMHVYGFDKPGRAVALVTGPLSHSVPRAFARMALRAGADLVLMPRFEAAQALALIERHAVTHVHLSPAMMLRLLRGSTRARHAGSLRHVVHGAAHCSPALKAEAIAAWGPIVHEYYGSTETGLLTLADSAEAAARPGTVGRALPGISLAVLDPDGGPTPPGTAGRIYARSATMHEFQYPGRQAERDAIGHGDLVTAGDEGHLDRDGYLFLADRGRDIIRCGAETIVPSTVEAAILDLPGVADCAVLGLEDENGSAVVCACVELLPGAAAPRDGIEAALARATRIPIRIAVFDRLPRADTGKVFKHRLRQQLAGLGGD